MLQSDILNAIKGDILTIYGEGNNIVPLVHIETFLAGIEKLIGEKIEFAVLKDQEDFSQK